MKNQRPLYAGSSGQTLRHQPRSARPVLILSLFILSFVPLSLALFMLLLAFAGVDVFGDEALFSVVPEPVALVAVPVSVLGDVVPGELVLLSLGDVVVAPGMRPVESVVLGSPGVVADGPPAAFVLEVCA
jgi:hypothetical protein